MCVLTVVSILAVGRNRARSVPVSTLQFVRPEDLVGVVTVSSLPRNDQVVDAVNFDDTWGFQCALSKAVHSVSNFTVAVDSVDLNRVMVG
jgi:hypothetical protein